MGPEIVHKEVVSIVDKEVQGIEHLFVVPDKRHFQILVNDLLKFLLRLILLMDELDLPLLLGFFQEEVCVTDDLI